MNVARMARMRKHEMTEIMCEGVRSAGERGVFGLFRVTVDRQTTRVRAKLQGFLKRVACIRARGTVRVERLRRRFNGRAAESLYGERREGRTSGE